MDSDDGEVYPIPMAELLLTADGMRLFRVRRTVMEMLRDREYVVSEMELCRSPEQFAATFGPEPSRNKLNFSTDKLSDPNDRVLVVFPVLKNEAEKVGVTTIRECAAAMKVNGALRGVLVVQKPLTPFAKQSLDEMDKKYKVDVFQESELLVNIMDSVFVPKHHVLLPEERAAVLKKYMIPHGKEEVCGQSHTVVNVDNLGISTKLYMFHIQEN